MIGRKKEIDELNRLYNSDKAQLVAVYGRRRVGKTYLIDEVMRHRLAFRHAGLSPAEVSGKNMMKKQLQHFYYSLQLHGLKKTKQPVSWLEAFYMLEQFLEEKDNGQKQVVFLDELPWMDTPRSGFLIAFEGFWNTWACHRPNLMVIVCGSANSWILDKLINNHGGLYNRVTYEIKLEPFTLSECKEYYEANHIRMSDYDIAQSYMIFGGIPFYLSNLQTNLSLAQNVDTLFFLPNAKFSDEFKRLFASAFANPDMMENIVKVLYQRNAGYTRKELSEKTGISEGGTLTEALRALLAGDFIEQYVPFGESERTIMYKLTDPFCIFYLHFVEKKRHANQPFWQESLQSPEIVSWRGFAFENLCFRHIRQIKMALGISSVKTTQSAWIKKDDNEGTQIDMIISRADNVVNMCEIKYYSDEFEVDKAYYRTLLHRQEMLQKKLGRKEVIHPVLISTFGIRSNEYSSYFMNVISLTELMP
ncbi:MAG: AAA family ATPase [Blautia sp.]|nr:AAA family ATPase [Blautia sp.]